MENEERVKHYSLHDWAYGSEFRKLQKKIDDSSFELENPTAMDLIELSNVCLIFKDADSLLTEPQTFLHNNKAFEAEARKTLFLHFGKIDALTIQNDLNQITKSNSEGKWDYTTNDYLEVLLSYAKCQNLSPDSLRVLFSSFPLRSILKYEELSHRLKNEIKTELLKNLWSMEILTETYDKSDGEKYYLPSLTNSEVDAIAMAYCNLPNPHPTCLEFLIGHRDNKDSYILKRRARVAAKKSLESFWKNAISNPSPSVHIFKRNIMVSLKEDARKLIDIHHEQGNTEVTISAEAVRTVKTPLEAFDLLAAAGQLIDDSGCCTVLPYNPNVISTINLLFEKLQKNSYGCQDYFRKQDVYRCIFFCLAENFERVGISPFEGCRQYVRDRIDPLLEGSELALQDVNGDTYYQRCEALVPQIESVLSRYEIYVEEGEISKDLVEANRSFVKTDDYKSLVPEKKYYSFNSESNEAERIRLLLFGDQSLLNYIDNTTRADSFAELFETFRIFKESYKIEDCKHNIDFLIGKGILVEDDEGLRFVDEDVSFIWHRLQEDRFITVFALSPKQKGILDNYVQSGWCTCYSSLFSHEEADFLDFWLNDSKFSNSVGLRNKHMHGQTILRDEDECRADYWMALRILMICLCKIYYDLKDSQSVR